MTSAIHIYWFTPSWLFILTYISHQTVTNNKHTDYVAR